MATPSICFDRPIAVHQPVARVIRTPPELQGAEKQSLRDSARSMRERWQHYVARDLVPGTKPQMVEYQPMSPKRPLRVEVRYQIRGRAEPMSYPLDEE